MKEPTSHLRQQAEQYVHRAEIDVSTLSELDIKRLVHDLDVHRIELELQNEELQRANKEIEHAKRRYADLFECAPVGYLALDRQYRISEVNLAFTQLVGVPKERVEAVAFTDFIYPDFQDLFHRAINTFRNTRQQQSIELQLKGTGGQLFWARVEITSFDSGQAYLLSVSDVTEQKHAEQRYELLSNVTLEGILVHHAGIVREVNASCSRITGYSRNELIDKNLFDLLITPDDRKKAQAHILQHDVVPYTVRMERKDGSTVHVEFEARNIDYDGKEVRIVAIRDVTERIQTEDALRNSEERFRAIFEQAAAGIITVDQQGQIVEVNQKFCEFLGYAHETLLQLSAEAIMWPDDREVEYRYIQEVIHGERNSYQLEKRYRHHEGHPVWANLSSNVVRNEQGDIQYAIGVVVDITEQKRAEKALENSEALLNETGKMAHIGGWEFDIETEHLVWTEEVYRIHEVETDYQPVLPEAIAFYAPESQPKISQAVQHAVEDGTPYDLELEFITAKGRRRWVRSIGQALQKYGNTVKVSGVFQDITARKQAEEQIHFQASLLDVVEQAVIVTDRQGGIMYNNPAARQLYGWSHEEMLGRNVNEVLTAPAMREQGKAILESLIQGHSWKGEFLTKRKDGSEFWIDVTDTPLFDKNGQLIGIIGMSFDISDRKHAETELKNTLAEKEVLLQEIHHRVKNNMQTIAGLLYKQQQYVQNNLTHKILEDSIQRVRSMALIHEHIYRSSNLARINLAEYIRDLANKLFRAYHQSSPGILLHVHVDDIYLPIDRSIPVALILNELLTNALKYAFPDTLSGEIRVECHRQTSEDIILTVVDNGVGLPEGFDLTHTSTLGGYLVYNLVTKQLGGFIEACSAEGITEFVIHFHP